MSKELEDIKAGDVVVLIDPSWNNSMRPTKVIRVTKTLIITHENTRWKRSDGRQQGLYDWSSCRIEPFTEDHKKTIEKNAIIHRRRKIVYAVAKMSNEDLLAMSYEQEEELLSFLPEDWE